jgi:hypothetical protein
MRELSILHAEENNKSFRDVLMKLLLLNRF